MLASASATERDLVSVGRQYCYDAGPERIAQTYTIDARPGFDLDVQRADDGWIIRDVETGIFGAGGTPFDAVADFHRATREHLDVLERQESLSDELLAQLQYLRRRTA